MDHTEPTEILTKIIQDLHSPAGSAIEFSSPDSIRKNRDSFIQQCHGTWKKLHTEATKQIVSYDSFLKSEKENPLGPIVESFGQYQRQVWRKVNDSIVWSLLGMRRFAAKRLYLGHDRGYLAHSNYESTMVVLDQLNADPMTMALWTDATSFVDMGDLLVVRPNFSSHPQFFELKAGAANAAVVDIMRTKDSNERRQKIRALETKYGKYGLDQLSRATKQHDTANQALQILRDEKGKDPITGLYLNVVTLDTKLGTYDEELEGVVKQALGSKSEVLHLIDSCLWLYINGDPEINALAKRQKFEDLLISKGIYRRHADRKAWDKDRIACLSDGLAIPTAKPLFLRAITPSLLAEVVSGELMFDVLLYIDWEKIGPIFKSHGAEFTWSSAREAGRSRSLKPALQSPIVGGRIPKFKCGQVTGSISDPNLVEILFDGAKPSSMVESLIEMAHKLESKADELQPHGSDTPLF